MQRWAPARLPAAPSPPPGDQGLSGTARAAPASRRQSLAPAPRGGSWSRCEASRASLLLIPQSPSRSVSLPLKDASPVPPVSCNGAKLPEFGGGFARCSPAAGWGTRIPGCLHPAPASVCARCLWARVVLGAAGEAGPGVPGGPELYRSGEGRRSILPSSAAIPRHVPRSSGAGVASPPSPVGPQGWCHRLTWARPTRLTLTFPPPMFPQTLPGCLTLGVNL